MIGLGNCFSIKVNSKEDCSFIQVCGVNVFMKAAPLISK